MGAPVAIGEAVSRVPAAPLRADNGIQQESAKGRVRWKNAAAGGTIRVTVVVRRYGFPALIAFWRWRRS